MYVLLYFESVKRTINEHNKLCIALFKIIYIYIYVYKPGKKRAIKTDYKLLHNQRK